jgi:hypothetical protein
MLLTLSVLLKKSLLAERQLEQEQDDLRLLLSTPSSKQSDFVQLR